MHLSGVLRSAVFSPLRSPQRPQDLDLNKADPETFLNSTDHVNIVLEPLDIQNCKTIDIIDKFSHTRLNFDGLLLTIQIHLDLHVIGRDRSHDSLSNSSKDLNFLGDWRQALGHNSNWNLSRTITEEQVVAVIQFIPM